MKFVVHPMFAADAEVVKSCILNFESQGELLGEAVRNAIKVFRIGERQINIKSFKKPTILNSFIYGYIRKSKARRSFEYAGKLLELGFGTPQPIAYAENRTALGLTDSYYVCEQLQPDLRFRDLTLDSDYPDSEEILRQFAHFSFRLHEAGVEFIDNTSGNILISKGENGRYNFYLVDLNRMNFNCNMSFSKRMSNLGKLTTDDRIVRIMSSEYARLCGKSGEEVYTVLKKKSDDFQASFQRRRRLKEKIRGRR